jgi:hypothetical protein
MKLVQVRSLPQIPIWRPHIVVNTAWVAAVHTGRTQADSIRYERYLTVIER